MKYFKTPDSIAHICLGGLIGLNYKGGFGYLVITLFLSSAILTCLINIVRENKND